MSKVSIKCQFCKEEIPNSSKYIVHCKEVHGNQKPFQCEVCSLRFSHNFNLKAHIENNHKNSKQFYCEECSHDYATKKLWVSINKLSMRTSNLMSARNAKQSLEQNMF